MSIHVWTHDRSCTSKDPINLIFYNISLQAIKDFLNDHDWRVTGFPLAHNQFIPTLDLFDKKMQDLQMDRGTIHKRYHVRLWDFSAYVLGSVHLERLSFLWHRVIDFETAEEYFSSICKKNPEWKVNLNSVDLGNRFVDPGKPINNGKATVIKKKKTQVIKKE